MGTRRWPCRSIHIGCLVVALLNVALAVDSNDSSSQSNSNQESNASAATPAPTPVDSSRRRSTSSNASTVATDGEGGGKKLRIAVIGGGIGGSTTTLELLRHKNVEITLFEQASQIGHNKSASGIIAALTATFNPGKHYWGSPDDPSEIVELLKQQIRFYKVDHWNRRITEFAHRMAMNKVVKKHDRRTSKEYKHHYNLASQKRMLEQIDEYPELCQAIQGPYCCRPGSLARSWIKHNNQSWTSTEAYPETCKTKRGLLHTWVDLGWSLANDTHGADGGHWVPSDHDHHEDLKGYRTEGGNNTAFDPYNFAAEWLREPDLAGVLWNADYEGFVRVETLYPVLEKLFARRGVKLALNCLVTGLKNETGDGIEVVAGPGCQYGNQTFDRVIVSGGANTVNILTGLDELIHSDMVPVKGFAVASHEKFFTPEQSGVGMQVEDLAHYIRPMIDGGVAYGFGKEIGTWDDELLDPKYPPGSWEVNGPRATGLGRAVMNASDLKRLAGMRPLCHFNDFPLLKRYPGKWSGLVLNTGFGFYGYTLSWKAAQIAADVAVTGKVSDEHFSDAIELYDACGNWNCSAWHMYLFLGWFAFGWAGWSLSVCCCCGTIYTGAKYLNDKDMLASPRNVRQGGAPLLNPAE